MNLSEELKASGEHQNANELTKIVDRLLKTREAKSGATDMGSKYVKGAPKALDRYYESCLKKFQGRRPDADSHCAKVALKITCGHVNPNHEICKGTTK